MRTCITLTAILLVAADAEAFGRRSRYRQTYNPPQSFYNAPGTPISYQPGSDALDQVNALRAQRGLPPYVRDEGLTAGAQACASARAAHLISDHTSNDFSYLPNGTSASAAGCGALDPSWGFGACCIYDNYRYAGAATVVGRDGRLFHHLFVR